jgi:hypothetical protein
MRLPTRALSRATAAALGLLAILGPSSADGADDLAARAACEAGLETAGDAPISAATVKACHKAFLASQSPHDTRNKVHALLAEKPKPDLDTIAISALMEASARKQAPDQPWGALIRLDIARYLRRADLVATSRNDLQRFAATNDVAREALANDRIGRAPIWVWILRALVLLGLVGTGVHALLNGRRAGAPTKTPTASQPAAALLVLVSLLVSSQAAANEMPDVKDGQMSRYKIDDAHPEVAMQKLLATEKDPLELGYLLQDLSAREAAAERKGDKAAQARYWHAMAFAAPTAFAPRKECETLESMGDIPGAIVPCREVLTRAGVVVDDYPHFVDLVLKNPRPLPAQEPQELENVIVHLEKELKPGSSNLPIVLRCKAALRFEDHGALEKCRTAMSKAPFNDPTVISIRWGLAVRDHDKEGALALVEEARKAGFDSQQVDRMLKTTSEMSTRRYQKAGIVGGLGILGVAIAFFGARLLASSRRRSATQTPA